MHYIAAAETDAGSGGRINQDSLMIRHAASPAGEILLAVLCDGMGGLCQGEAASGAVLKSFADWFERDLPRHLPVPDPEMIRPEWEARLARLNRQLAACASGENSRMGTTFAGLLLIGDRFLLMNVGDSRIYHIGACLRQLTMDHSFVAAEAAAGRLSPAEARRDRRRNLLLQCIGASRQIRPYAAAGQVRPGAYLLCSDGFYHEPEEDELCRALAPDRLVSREVMHRQLRSLIDLAIDRREQDNLSAIIIRIIS